MTRLTDYLNQTLYTLVMDAGNMFDGVAPTIDVLAVQAEFNKARESNCDVEVLALSDGSYVKVTDIFERRYQDWLDARPRKDEWGNEREEKEER